MKLCLLTVMHVYYSQSESLNVIRWLDLANQITLLFSCSPLMIHVQKVTLVAFALHDGKPPDTETLLVVLDQYVLHVQRDNFWWCKILRKSFQTLQKKFSQFSIFAEHKSVEGTLLPSDFHASSLTHANLEPPKSVSQNRHQWRAKLLQQWQSLFLSCTGMQSRLQGQF